MSLRFGTDGVRGVAGVELTSELVLALGRSAGRVLGRPGRPFVVGRDTRRSGPMLQAAFAAGVAAEGFDVTDVGVLPTPGVAWAAAERSAPAAVISASHNPFPDNGVKLLAAGRKLSDDLEARIEAGLNLENGPAPAGVSGAAVGTIAVDPGVAARYCQSLSDALDGRRLSGLRVVLDCGHGAAVTTAAAAFDSCGASVVKVLGAEPDGTNINAGCGSTDPGALAAAVVAHGADLGLAFDGDADRLIAVDDLGRVVDGDRLLALLALDLRDRGLLSGDAVAVTVMTNLGFHQAMGRAGIAVVTTPVGDRHIVEALEANGLALGGEQSGHIVFRNLATTGDGVLSGVLLADLLTRRGVRLSVAAAQVLRKLPQVLINVAVADPGSLHGAETVRAELQAVESDLGPDGRVLLRSSGTEPLVRVMVEAPSEPAARQAAERLARAVREALGTGP